MFTGTGVTTYSVNPGLVESEIERQISDLWTVKIMQCFRPCCYKTIPTDEGAAAPLYCCLESTLANETGLYYWCLNFVTFAQYDFQFMLIQMLLLINVITVTHDVGQTSYVRFLTTAFLAASDVPRTFIVLSRDIHDLSVVILFIYSHFSLKSFCQVSL